VISLFEKYFSGKQLAIVFYRYLKSISTHHKKIILMFHNAAGQYFGNHKKNHMISLVMWL